VSRDCDRCRFASVHTTAHLISVARIFRNTQCLNCCSYFPSRRHLLAIHQPRHTLHLSCASGLHRERHTRYPCETCLGLRGIPLAA
jgi:hypothetical protein